MTIRLSTIPFCVLLVTPAVSLEWIFQDLLFGMYTHVYGTLGVSLILFIPYVSSGNLFPFTQ